MVRCAIASLGLLLSTAACYGEQAAPPEPQEVSEGKRLFDQWCGTCHAPGSRMPGTLALEVKYEGQRSGALEDEPVAEELTHFVVRNGVEAMPRFRKTEISDEDLSKISRYLLKEIKK